jgi:hypothetical protein
MINEASVKKYYFNANDEFITHLYGNIWYNATSNKLIFMNYGCKRAKTR